MRKLIAFFTTLTVLIWVVGPLVTVAGATPNATTTLTLVQGSGTKPVVLVKWEMYKPETTQCGDEHNETCGHGEDADDAPGAQFAAPGEWGKVMEYTVCAIVTDENGLADISEVNARIYYPSNAPMHLYSYNYNTEEYQQLEDPDTPSSGCAAFIEKNTLRDNYYSFSDGYDVFCNQIRENNFNLPVPNSSVYRESNLTQRLNEMYNDICGDEGRLKKGTAKIYCDDKWLLWEEPAGDYLVQVTAVDKGGLVSDPLENNFTYLTSLGFEIDFNSVNYGEVLYNTKKVVAGDKTFTPGGDERPTIRNLSNRRVKVGIAQDDMGLCENAGLEHVTFDARVGTGSERTYHPFAYKSDNRDPLSNEYTWLSEYLDLSEIEEMDFSILITNWPYNYDSNNKSYTGHMWLTISPVNWTNNDCPNEPHPANR